MKRLFIILSTLIFVSCSNTPTITLKATYLGPIEWDCLEDMPENELIVREKLGNLCIDYNYAWRYYCSERDIKPVLDIFGDTLFVKELITCSCDEGAYFELQYKIHHLPYGKYVLIYECDSDFPATEIDYQPNMQPITIPERPNKCLYGKDSETDTTLVWYVVEKMPEFPGGTEALFKYIETNTMTIDSLNSTKRPIVQFAVERDGSLSNIEVVRSCGIEELDKDAISVVENMPKWKPGKVRGIPVRVKYTIPINYRPKK